MTPETKPLTVADILPELSAAAIRAVEAVMPERADAVFALTTPADVCRREVARALAALGVDGVDTTTSKVVVYGVREQDRRRKCPESRHATCAAGNGLAGCTTCKGTGYVVAHVGEVVLGGGLNVEVVPGESIRIFGVAHDWTRARAVDRTFRLGDHVVVGSYNLTYVEPIARIARTLVGYHFCGERRERRMFLAEFARRNWRLDENGAELERIAKSNAETSMTL